MAMAMAMSGGKNLGIGMDVKIEIVNGINIGNVKF